MAELDDIKRYLEDKMDQDELTRFEERLHNDSEFKHTFELNKAVLMGIEDHFDLKLKDRLRSEDTLMKLHQKHTLIPWMIAASLLLVIMAGIFVYQQMFHFNGHELFANYYKPYYNIVEEQTRGNSNEQNQKAYQLYDKRIYDQAAAAFEIVINESPGDQAALFYCGVSYLASGQSSQAIQKFRLVNDSTNKFYYPASWYLGLSYLKTNQKEEAIATFTKLSSDPTSYQKKAREILDQLD